MLKRLDECLDDVLKRVRYGGDDLGGAAWTALGLGLLSHSGPPSPFRLRYTKLALPQVIVNPDSLVKTRFEEVPAI